MPRTSQQPFHVSESTQETISILQDCHDECRKMLMEHAPKENGHTLSFLHVKRLQACIEICGTTANYLLKDGILADRLCEIAARICEQCAYSCERTGDAHFEECAELCRETAEACLDESYHLKRMEAGYV